MKNIKFELTVMVLCFLILIWLIISGVRGAKGAEVLSITVQSSGLLLEWDQPQQFQMVCITRYYGAEYPSGKCFNDTLAGHKTSYWRYDDPVPAFRPAQGDKYVLCYSSVIDGDNVCRPVAEAFNGPRPVYRTYVAVALAQGPGTAPAAPKVYLGVIRR